MMPPAVELPVQRGAVGREGPRKNASDLDGLQKRLRLVSINLLESAPAQVKNGCAGGIMPVQQCPPPCKPSNYFRHRLKWAGRAVPEEACAFGHFIFVLFACW